MFNQEHHEDGQEKKEPPTTWPSLISRELLLENMRLLMGILQLLKSLKENFIIDWERVVLGSSKSVTMNSWQATNQLRKKDVILKKVHVAVQQVSMICTHELIVGWPFFS